MMLQSSDNSYRLEGPQGFLSAQTTESSSQSFTDRSLGNVAIAHRNGKSLELGFPKPVAYVCNAIYWHLTCNQICLLEFPLIVQSENRFTAIESFSSQKGDVFTKVYFSQKNA